MARNDDTEKQLTERETAKLPEPARKGVGGSDDRTSEYPEIESGWSGSDAEDEIGKPIGVTGPIEMPARSSGGGAMRGLFWLVATIGLVVALVLGAKAIGFWPDLKNPFATKTTDRSQPALLKSIQDLSRYVAAEGNFEVIVDVQQDRKYIPDFLLSERILFIAAGSVECYVDFANIGQGAVKESDDRRTVEISLPAPQLGKPNLDNDRSYVYEEQRGAFNRLNDLFNSDPNRLQEVYKLSETKIAAAAKDSGLPKRAEDNTRKMLEGLLRSLGYTTITVKFAAP